MLHKIGILFLCERCGRAVGEDEIGWESDGGEDICAECLMTQNQADYDHWKPLYDGEVQAGLHDPEGNDND